MAKNGPLYSRYSTRIPLQTNTSQWYKYSLKIVQIGMRSSSPLKSRSLRIWTCI